MSTKFWKLERDHQHNRPEKLKLDCAQEQGRKLRLKKKKIPLKDVLELEILVVSGSRDAMQLKMMELGLPGWLSC